MTEQEMNQQNQNPQPMNPNPGEEGELINSNINPIEKRGEEGSIVCWNCLTVLKINPEWNIVQCPNCDKFNRIPKPEPQQKKDYLNLNSEKNHFDIVAPYVYAVMTCPYCQEENKVRKEAEHIICYNCFNSFCIENPTIKCISSKNQGPINIPSKVKRISDMYFPDPMPLPGRIPPQPIIVQANCPSCQNNEDIVHEAINTLVEQKHPVKVIRDKNNVYKMLVKDVDGMMNKRLDHYNNINNNINNIYNGIKGNRSLSGVDRGKMIMESGRDYPNNVNINKVFGITGRTFGSNGGFYGDNNRGYSNNPQINNNKYNNMGHRSFILLNKGDEYSNYTSKSNKITQNHSDNYMNMGGIGNYAANKNNAIYKTMFSNYNGTIGL